MSICVCKYPLIVTDNRGEDEKVFISIPLEILGEVVPVPNMEPVDEIGFDNIKRKYMKIEWQDIPKNAKRYNVNEHIVLAGCSEEAITCDSKSIYAVYHPMDEWNKYHMLEIN
jgi:hypothetical protein